MNRRTIDFTTGSIAKPLVAFSIPLFFGNILQQLYSITDAIIVGNLLGPDALAAIGATSPITNLSIALAIGITLGVSVTVSQFFGAHEPDKVRLTISTGYIFFFVFGLAIMLAGILLTPAILRLISTPPEIFADAVTYLRITFAGTVFLIGYNVTNSMFRGFGNSRMPLILLAVSTALNVFLDYILIRYGGMGVGGAALATITSQAVAFIFAFVVFQRSYGEFRLTIRRGKHFSRDILSDCLRIGIPSGLKGSTYWLGFVFITSVINRFGAATIAAYSIAAKIDALLQTPMISLQNGLSTFVGQNAGANKPDRIKSGVRTSMSIGFIFAIFMTVAVFCFARPILSLFTDSTEVIEIGTGYLRITSVFYIIYALQEVVQGVAVGVGNTLILLCSTIVAMWIVRVPLVYAAAARFGAEGIWWCLPSGWFIAAAFANGYYLSGKWKDRIKKKFSS